MRHSLLPIISIIIITIIPLDTAASEKIFRDVPDSYWASDHIEHLTERNIINGYADGTFRAQEPLQWVHIGLMLERQTNPASQKKNMPVNNVPISSPHHDTFSNLKSVGAFNDVEEEIDLYSNITRGEMAVVLQNTYNITGSAQNDFPDVKQDHPYYDAINALVDNGIAEGHRDGNFKPAQSLTRVEFVTFLNRVLKMKEFDPDLVNHFYLNTYPTPVGWEAPKINGNLSDNSFENLQTINNHLTTSDQLQKHGLQLISSNLEGYNYSLRINDWYYEGDKPNYFKVNRNPFVAEEVLDFITQGYGEEIRQLIEQVKGIRDYNQYSDYTIGEMKQFGDIFVNITQENKGNHRVHIRNQFEKSSHIESLVVDVVDFDYTDDDLNEITNRVIERLNKERESRGAEPLQKSKELTNIAQIKSEDMIENKYFDHESPTYGLPQEMANHFEVDMSVGENIGLNQRSDKLVFEEWMASDGHRRNMLNEKWNYIGIGLDVKDAKVTWTMLLGY